VRGKEAGFATMTATRNETQRGANLRRHRTCGRPRPTRGDRGADNGTPGRNGRAMAAVTLRCEPRPTTPLRRHASYPGSWGVWRMSGLAPGSSGAAGYLKIMLEGCPTVGSKTLITFSGASGQSYVQSQRAAPGTSGDPWFPRPPGATWYQL